VSPDEQFWWNWCLQLFTGLATFAAVVVALSGHWLRHKLAPPKLRIRLKSETGTESDAYLQPQGPPDQQPFTTLSRWYHIHVENSRRGWADASSLQVFLTKIEEPDPAGQFISVWSEDVPLGWRHGHENPSSTRVVGRHYDADLCVCTEMRRRLPARGLDCSQ
jgi:hypothetical protein